MGKLIIGLMGPSGCGKDTVADMMTELLGVGVTRLAFANHLKQVLACAGGLELEHLYDVEKKNGPILLRWCNADEVYAGFIAAAVMGGASEDAADKLASKMVDLILRTGGATYRQAMEAMDDFRSVCHPRVWIDRVEYQAYVSDNPVIITDVRQQNEVDSVHSLNGKVIRVIRPGTGSRSDHISEKAPLQIQADYVIDNSGSLEDLKAAVSIALSEIRR